MHSFLAVQHYSPTMMICFNIIKLEYLSKVRTDAEIPSIFCCFGSSFFFPVNSSSDKIAFNSCTRNNSDFCMDSLDFISALLIFSDTSHSLFAFLILPLITASSCMRHCFSICCSLETWKK